MSALWAIPHKTEMVLALNPLAFILDAYRQVLMHATAPDWIAPGADRQLGFAVLLLVMVLIMRRSSQYLALRALS